MASTVDLLSPPDDFMFLLQKTKTGLKKWGGVEEILLFPHVEQFKTVLLHMLVTDMTHVILRICHFIKYLGCTEVFPESEAI